MTHAVMAGYFVAIPPMSMRGRRRVTVNRHTRRGWNRTGPDQMEEEEGGRESRGEVTQIILQRFSEWAGQPQC